MRIHRIVLLAGLACTAAASSACENITRTPCALGPAAVEAYIMNTNGAYTAAGTTVIATRGTDVDTIGPIVYPFLPEDAPVWIGDAPGTYTITASKPFWTPVTTQVTVGSEGRCDYPDTEQVMLEMSLLPNAPAVRSVIVAPRWIEFISCEAAVTAAAHVDAAAGQTRSVRWQTGDSTIVSVNETGRMLPKRRGTTRVTATSVADTTVKGSLEVKVSANCV